MCIRDRPDSGLDAAIGYAGESGIPYAIGFTKNKYIGRTFIAPAQNQRETGVNIKLNPIRPAVEGKRVVLIDDSIVRGTTCRRTIQLLWGAGAREVHMRVSAPAFVAQMCIRDRCWMVDQNGAAITEANSCKFRSCFRRRKSAI